MVGGGDDDVDLAGDAAGAMTVVMESAIVWQKLSAVTGLADGDAAGDGVTAVVVVAGMSMVNRTSPCSTLMLQQGETE
jgi:hypothetical protein